MKYGAGDELESTASNESSPLLNVLLGRPSRLIRRSKVTLVERPNLIRLERTHDSVQDAAVVEENEIVRAPIVQSTSDHPKTKKGKAYQSCG
jgi:hypothetical protein